MNKYNILKSITNNKYKFSFEQFCKFIQEKNVLQEATLFLEELTIKLKPQLLLTIYLLNGYKKYLLHLENDKNLIILCKTIVNNIDSYLQSNDTQTKSLLKTTIILFNKRFESWKKKDVNSQIIYYCNSFCELQDIINKTKQDIYKNEIVKIQIKLKNKIINLDKENGETFLLNYQKKYIEESKLTNKLLIEKLTKTMKEAFWKKLSMDLQENPPNLLQIPSILKDINLAFHTLVPNKKEIKKNIDEYLNYDFLKQLIEKNCFSNEKMFNLVEFCFHLLKDLGIPEKDKEINELIQWNNKSKKNKNFKLYEYLPKVLMEILSRIEEIQNRIVLLQNIKKK